MIFNAEIASKVANSLLQIKAIKLQPSNPFTWTSGWKAPIYCDNRKILSYPDIRTFVRQQLAGAIVEKFGKPDVIAGVVTGGIAHGALVAEELGLPFVYVRTTVKVHGLKNMIEGHLEAGKAVVVVEDLVSTGQSSLKAVKALKKSEANVKGMVAIFTYGLKVAEENFKKQKCDLTVLSDYPTLINQALKSDYINEKEYEMLKAWRKNPGWVKKIE